MVALSVVIITLNEEKTLPRLLDCLERQTFCDFEVIVADSPQTTDRTREIALVRGCRVVDGGTFSVGRNNGARAARGETLVFFDADSVFNRDFLERNYNAFIRGGFGIASVPLVPLSSRVGDRVAFGVFNIWSRVVASRWPQSTGNGIFVRRDVFERLNGFCEDVVFAEDMDFVNRGKKYGFGMLPVGVGYSVRRFDSEGRVVVFRKALRTALYRARGREITQRLFAYEPHRE